MRNHKYIKIGKLNRRLFKRIHIDLITDRVILTYERLNHIEHKRQKLFNEVKNVLSNVIYNPDYIYQDWNNRPNTIVLIKKFNTELNISIVLKVAIPNDKRHKENSVITMIKIGEKTFNKIIRNKKDKLIYRKIDKYE